MKRLFWPLGLFLLFLILVSASLLTMNSGDINLLILFWIIIVPVFIILFTYSISTGTCGFANNFYTVQPLPALGAALVCLLSVLTAIEGFTCSNSECLTIPFGTIFALAALAVQLFLFLPVHHYIVRTTNLPDSLFLREWIAISLALFLIPMFFTIHVYL